MPKIHGFTQAAKVLGVGVQTIRRTVIQAEKKGLVPPKESVRGGPAYTWKDEQDLHGWFARVRNGTAYRPLEEEKDTPISSSPMLDTPVLGARSAAAYLGVTRHVVEKALQKLKEAESDLVPGMRTYRGGEAYYWRSEKALAAWWVSVRELLATSYPVPPARPSDDVLPEPKVVEGEALLRVLGEDTVNALKQVRELFDTPEVRLYRELKKEPKVEMSLGEVLQLVVARGLAALEEDLEDEEEA